MSTDRAIPTNKKDYDKFVKELSVERLGISIEDLLEIIPGLHRVSKALTPNNLYIDRFAGMLRGTNKSDPFDCSYVKKCAIIFMEKKDEFDQLKADIAAINEKLSGGARDE